MTDVGSCIGAQPITDHSWTVTTFFLRAGLTTRLPGALCCIRRRSFFASASMIVRRVFAA